MNNFGASLSTSFNALGDGLLIQAGFNDPSGVDWTTQHIIPRQFTDMIKKILPNYNPDNPRNLMELPYKAEDSIVSGLARQGGGHSAYNEHIRKHLEKLAEQRDRGEINTEQFEERLGEKMGELRCRHNRAAADRAPNQIKLHSNDPNVDMTHDLGTNSANAAATREAAPYVQRLHAHNLEHNPAHAQLNERAADPAAQPRMSVKTPSRINVQPEQQEPPTLDGDDNSCTPNNGTRPAPEEQEQPDNSTSPSTMALAAARYGVQHPRQVAALASTAAATVELTAAGMPTAVTTRGVSLLPAAGSALATAGIATVMTIGIAGQAAADTLAGDTSHIVSAAEAIPSLAALHKNGGDIMGPRSEVNQIAIRFTGAAPGSEQNSPASLYMRDVEAGFTHMGGHLLIKANGDIVRDERYMRPFDENPQIAAGHNANTLGVMIEGKELTGAQRQSLQELQKELGTEWKQQARPGDSPVNLFGASYAENVALSPPTAANDSNFSPPPQLQRRAAAQAAMP